MSNKRKTGDLIVFMIFFMHASLVSSKMKFSYEVKYALSKTFRWTKWFGGLSCKGNQDFIIVTVQQFWSCIQYSIIKMATHLGGSQRLDSCCVCNCSESCALVPGHFALNIVHFRLFKCRICGVFSHIRANNNGRTTEPKGIRHVATDLWRNFSKV